MSAETLLEGRDEVVDRPLELLGELDEPGEIVLARDLALAEAVGITSSRPWSRAVRRASDSGRPSQRLQELPRAVA